MLKKLEADLDVARWYPLIVFGVMMVLHYLFPADVMMLVVYIFMLLVIVAITTLYGAIYALQRRFDDYVFMMATAVAFLIFVSV